MVSALTPTELLDLLADLRAAADKCRLDWETARDAILAPVKPQLADLDAEYTPMLAEVQAKLADAESLVKEAVLREGASVKGKHLHAIWSKGRVSWDTKKLDGLMIALPQLNDCRTEGQPSVSIRTI